MHRGSTFKIVTATAGYMEGVINLGEGINCTGKFDTPPFDEQPINCWNIYGHGGGDAADGDPGFV